MPIAIVVGCAPVVFFTGPQKLATDQDEMAVAGGLAGRAMRVTKAKTVDLEIPADAAFTRPYWSRPSEVRDHLYTVRAPESA